MVIVDTWQVTVYGSADLDDMQVSVVRDAVRERLESALREVQLRLAADQLEIEADLSP